MALFLDEQTLKDLEFTIKESNYSQSGELVLLIAKLHSKEYDVVFRYSFYKNGPHRFELLHDEGLIIVPNIETMDQFLQLASVLKF